MVWRHNGRASVLRRGRGFDPRSEHGCVQTLGKLFTPLCLDDDRPRYYLMASLNNRILHARKPNVIILFS